MTHLTHMRHVDADVPSEAVCACVLAHRLVDDDSVQEASASDLGDQGRVHAGDALSQTLAHFLCVTG